MASSPALPLSPATRLAIAGLLIAVLVVPQVGGHSLGILPAAQAPAPAAAPGASPGGGVLTVTPIAPTVSMPVDPSGVLPSLPWEAAGQLTRSQPGTPWKTLLAGGVPAADDDGPADCAGQGDPVDATPAGGARTRLCFWCPGLEGTPSINDGTNTMTLRGSCPYRIIDDADLLGSPQIAVNQNDPNSVAFFSLHGGGSNEGPTPRSRDPSPDGMAAVTGLSHTTFTSQDHGRAWHDNPWGTDGFGEHIAGTMDADGNLYIGALWSKRLGEGRFDYVIKLYKEQDGRYQISTYQPSKTYSNRASGNTIDQVSLVYVPDFVAPAANATTNQTTNGTAPADQSDVGNSTTGEDFGQANSANDRIVAVWFERALDWRNSTTGKSSWIDAAWTDTTARDNWTRLADKELIGPCMAASNAVVYGGKAYVACVADAGYNGRSRARIGDVDVWSIDPLTGKTRLEDFTRLVGGQPRLTARPDGYMAVGSVNVAGPTEIDVQVTFGWYGRNWEGPQNVGGQFHAQAATAQVEEARITAMALAQETNTLFLTYMERIPGDFQAPDPNPSTLNPGPQQLIEYHKILATMTECTQGLIDAYDLQLGVARHPFAEGSIGNATGVFDDLQDGMALWIDPATGDERIYFAYGDHGVIQYGALEGDAGGIPCPVIAPPVSIPPPPIPAALSTTSPASLMVGATVGATALAMVTYLLAAKRRTAVFSTTKARK